MNIEPLSLEVTESPEAARVRVRLRGELDLASADAVAERLRRLHARGASVVLDLDELQFIDASGIGMILDAAESARQDGWAFTVTHGSPHVRRVFGLLDVGAYLTFDGDR